MIDPERLARALWLRVERLGKGRFRVVGGHEPHTVALEDGAFSCDCEDFVLRATTDCKHVLALRIRRGDPDVIAALRKVPRESVAA